MRDFFISKFINLTLVICKCKITIMKKTIAILSAFMGFIAVFGDVHAYVDRGNAVVTILDKASGKTQNATLPVGQLAKYEKLNLVVRACKQTDPFMAENAYMFIEIINANNDKIFGGWMNKNAPGENPLQNADYDIWLVRCE